MLLRLQVGLECRLKHEHRRCLRHRVPDAGQAQWPEPAGLLLRNQDPAHRLQRIGSFPKLLRQFLQPALQPGQLDLRKRLPADPGRAAVQANPGPGLRQEVNPPDLVDQGMKATIGFILRFRMQHGLEFPNVAGPCRAPASGLALPPFHAIPEAGPLPSTGIARRLRYCGPVRRPAGPARPSRDAGWPVQATGRASRVAASSILRACRRHCPGGNGPVHPSLASRTAVGLPHFPGWSASASPVSRLARRSPAFRPARSPGRPGRPFPPRCFKPCRCLHDPPRPLPTEATIGGRDSHPQGKRAFPLRAGKCRVSFVD